MRKRMAAKLPPSVLDEASAWFVEFNEGSVDLPAREEFIQWLRVSPEHVRAYLQICAHWEDAQAIEKSHKQDIGRLIEIARTEDNVVPLQGAIVAPPQGRHSQTVRRRPARVALLATAASLLVFFASALTWQQLHKNTYSAGIGEQRSIRLADGSTLELNSRSKIRVSFDADQREVELLEGQALFRVAKETTRPFIVSSGNARVRAVGTQFDVYKKRSATVVTVVEGRVAVLNPASRLALPQARMPAVETAGSRAPAGKGIVYLSAGEQLTVTRAAIEVPRYADVAVATAWTQKQLIFRNTPLTDVVEEFNRYNTRPMAITDARIEGLRISGVFSSANPQSLLRGLEALGAFRIHETSRQIDIAPK